MCLQESRISKFPLERKAFQNNTRLLCWTTHLCQNLLKPLMSWANQLILLHVVFVRYVYLHRHSRWVCVAARASVTGCSRRSLDIVGGHWPSSNGCGLHSYSTVRVSYIVSTCTWKFCEGIARISVICYSEVLTDLFTSTCRHQDDSMSIYWIGDGEKPTRRVIALSWL